MAKTDNTLKQHIKNLFPVKELAGRKNSRIPKKPKPKPRKRK
jgi:hypothetical protein